MAKKIVPESEFIINPDGSAFHIHVRPDQLTDRIIMCGTFEIPVGASYDEIINIITKERN